MKTVIENGTILTMRGSEPEIVHGNIGIEDDTIAFVGKEPETFSRQGGIDRRIEAGGGIVMPGLINAHTHISMSLMRHWADDLPFWNWLFDRILPVEENMGADDAYYGAQLSLAELIRGGVTTFADMYFFMDRVAEAAIEAGMRANLSRGLAFNGPEDISKLEESRRFYERWNGAGGGRIRVDIGPHAVYTCPPDYLEKVAQLAEDLETGVHIHLSESRKEVEDSKRAHGMSPVALVKNAGLLEHNTYAAHCVHIDEEDIQILKDYDVGVLHNPTSNMKLGNGFAPTGKLLDAGVNVGLGTDGSASNNNLNMFEEMHLAALVHKGVEEDPERLSAYTALQMATINNARALGIDKITGSLEAGKKADLIILDTEKPHFYPRHNAIASLVYAASGADVHTVICNGDMLMDNRTLSTLNERKIFQKAQESAERMTKTE